MEVQYENKPLKVVATGEPSATVLPRRGWPWRAILLWSLSLLVLGSTIYYGIHLRRAAWDATSEIRFLNSVSNAIEWGSYANEQGVFQLYDKLIAEQGSDGRYRGPARFSLDYAPLRLLIAAKWAEWSKVQFPPKGPRQVWQPAYEFTAPMLKLNMACELAAMLGMFLLVYHWMRMCNTPPPEKWWSWSLRQHWGRDEQGTRHLPSTVGLMYATVAALLIWLNPAVIFNAHVYPQWDAWLLPAFIFAVYFGVRNWWLAAGFVVGVCAMAKGQILFALPLLIAWPLLLGHLAGVLRVIIGLITGIALVVWPWLMQTYDAWHWMLYVSAATVMMVAVAAMPQKGWKWQGARVALLLGAIAIALTPVIHLTGHYDSPGGIISLDRRRALLTVLGVFAVITFLGGRRWLPTIAAGFPAVCSMLTIPLLKGSTAWFEIGILFPTRNWKQLFWCHGTNLGSILQSRYQWKYEDMADLSWIPGMAEPVPIRHVMMAIFIAMLVLCVLGFVRHRRRHDPRMLMAMAVPLMLAYTFLPQMIERYLLWPAALLSAYAAMSLGALSLWLALSLMATALMAGYIMPFVRASELSKAWLPTIDPLFPDLGWAVIVLAIVMLYMGCTSSGRKPPWARRQEAQAPKPSTPKRYFSTPTGTPNPTRTR